MKNRHLLDQLTAALAQGETRAARRIVLALSRRMPPGAVGELLAAVEGRVLYLRAAAERPPPPAGKL